MGRNKRPIAIDNRSFWVVVGRGEKEYYRTIDRSLQRLNDSVNDFLGLKMGTDNKNIKKRQGDDNYGEHN